MTLVYLNSFYVVLLLFSSFRISSGVCYERLPEKNKFREESIYRLGKTRFFVHYDTRTHHPWALGFRVFSQQNWVQYCPKIHEKARLSKPDKISTNAIIARHLELLTKTKNFTYFNSAHAGENVPGVYKWVASIENGGPQIEYTNVFYKAPRIIGENMIKYKKNVLVNESMENDIDFVHDEDRHQGSGFGHQRCMAFSLPFKNNPSLGFQASWTERDCNNAASAICEIDIPECNENGNLNPHVLTEDKEYYYTEGNWLFANRRFIVSWKPRKKGDAEKYCLDYNLKLFEPTLLDMCLIPYLKMWGMVISTYQFYTSYKYYPETKTFLTTTGAPIQEGAKKANRYLMEGRSVFNPMDPKYTEVAYVWSYERKNETACGDIGCKWMYYMLAPIHGQMAIGTICQHKEQDNLRACDFERGWNNDFTEALAPTAMTEFGFQGSGLWRSNYKQTFASHICGHPDRQMISKETVYWNVKVESVEYLYDYDETFWVVDEGLFEHVGKHEPLCSVSSLTKVNGTFERTLSKVNCDEWHFYLCELIF